MEDINDAGYKYAKRFCKDLKKKNDMIIMNMKIFMFKVIQYR